MATGLLVALLLAGGPSGPVTDRAGARNLAACALRFAPDETRDALRAVASLARPIRDPHRVPAGFAAETIRVGVHRGEIRDISPQDESFHVFVAPVHGPTGWLAWVEPVKDGLQPDLLGYEFEKAGSGWRTTDGNGGPATYAAMARYVTRTAFVWFTFTAAELKEPTVKCVAPDGWRP